MHETENIKVYPGSLCGPVALPPGKSLAHRVILAKALGGNLKDSLPIKNPADDIIKTFESALSIENCTQDQVCRLHCKDSGTTLRMLLPSACALFPSVEVYMTEGLAARPVDPLLNVLREKGCTFKFEKTESDNISEPVILRSRGLFKGGDCCIPGNISSQYISGLLYALPLTEKGGTLNLTTGLSSEPYVDMTLAVLKDSGIEITTENKIIPEKPQNSCEMENHPVFHVPGNQKYKDNNADISMGDWSAAGFFAVANCLGSSVEMTNLSCSSIQGDRKVCTFTEQIMTQTEPVIDLENNPDLFPPLCVLACYQKKQTHFTGIKRLRLKESDRIESVKSLIENLGGTVYISDSTFTVDGTGSLKGGITDSFNDHRIAMAAAVAALNADGPVTILNSGCCAKSYPDFFRDFENLGGKIVKLDNR